MSSSSILFKISLVVKLEKHKNTSTNYNISIIYIFCDQFMNSPKGWVNNLGDNYLEKHCPEDLLVIEQQVKRGVAIFAKACFGHPSPSKRQKLNATANAFGLGAGFVTLPQMTGRRFGMPFILSPPTLALRFRQNNAPTPSGDY